MAKYIKNSAKVSKQNQRNLKAGNDILSASKARSMFNCSESDMTKAVYLLKNLILLGKLSRFPTAKDITLEFFNSNVKRDVKLEVADYLLKETYLSPQFLAKFLPIKTKSYSKFIKGVINYLDKEFNADEYLGADFNFVRRETMFWLIKDSEEPKFTIQSMFKEKIDWFDFPTQNGILDYCFQKNKELGKEFVMDILNRAIKVNMREVRITALRYAYLLSKDKKYLLMIREDPSKQINNLLKEFISEEQTSKKPKDKVNKGVKN